MFNKKFFMIVAFVWLAGVSLFPRSVEVLNNNFIFLLDQGRDYISVRDIMISHKPTLIGAQVGSGMAGLQGLFHGPFYFYLLSIPFIIFQGDPYGGLLIMFIFGLLTIMTGFLFGRKVLGVFGGLTVAFLIAVSPPLIAQSRFIWSPHPSTLFIVLFFYFTFLAYKKKKLHLFLAAFFAGFLYNFEFAIAVPLSLSVFFYLLFLLKRQLHSFLFVLAGFVVAYAPLILFEVKHGFQALKGFGSYFSRSKGLEFAIDLRPFLHNFSDTFPKFEILPAFIILFVFLLALVFFTLQEKRKHIKSFVYFLSLTWVITVIIMSLLKSHVFEYYLIHINVLTIFLFTYIIIFSYEKKHILFQVLFTILLGSFLYYGTKNSINTTKRDLSDYGGMVKMRGKLEAIDHIYQDAKGDHFGLLIFSPPVYTYPYDYLLWWYGQKKYNYIPHKEKKGLFYLLIEKDLSEPWTYKGWLETVVKTGKVLETKELPSGFIIQKRVHE